MTGADADRMRGTSFYAQAHIGRCTLSEFINRAIDAYVTDLEHQYNDDEPFPPLPVNMIPTGRPVAG